MKHAEICPVCGGTGKVNMEKCHGCDGKGWVEVEGECGQPIRPWPIWTATDAESDK